MKSLKNTAKAIIVLSAASACAMSRNESTIASIEDKGQVYVFESDSNGFNTKTMFYDNGQEVVAFDAQFTPALAEQAIAFLRQKSQNPIKYLVVTHPNPDKFNGIAVFKNAGAKVVASNATAIAMPSVHAYKKYFFVNIAKMFTEESYPALGSIDITFDGRHDLQLDSGEKILIQELSGPGVSSTQTVALVPTINALMVGDLVHHKAHAWLEGGIINGKPTPTITGWIADLEELKSQFGRRNPIVYGGRGEAVQLSEAANQQIAYLKKANQVVTDYVTALGDRRSELDGAEAQTHYANIQKSIEVSFPDYSLGYMIQYGVYGLALSK